MILGYLEPGIFTELWIQFLAFLNDMIYSLVSVLCGLFTDISGVRLFGDTIIEDFTKRIYVVLGIYMLFKLAISLLNSIINPDNLLDKQKGMQKIIPRSVIALVMLVVVPDVFGIAFKYQNTIALAVPKIVLGKGSMTNLGDEGETLAATALKAFYEPIEDSDCRESAATNLNEVSTVDQVLDLSTRVCNTVTTNEKTFAYEFNGFIGLAAGIFMIVSLASYCVDIAIRSIKLGLLQMLAPIPIISYIDPKSEKDGAFGHWTKECVSTYLEVFIKLGILYFVISILGQIASDKGELLGGASANAFVKVFLIIGAFFFMGKAADFICNIIGVKPPKDGGGFFKGLAGIAGLGATAVAGVSRGVTAARANAKSAEVRGKGKLSQAGAALRGALVGSTAGLLGGANALMKAKPGENVAAKIGQDAYKKNMAKMAAGSAGSTFMGRTMASMQRAVLGNTPADIDKKKLEGLKAISTAAKQKKDYVLGKARADANTYVQTHGVDFMGSRISYSLQDLDNKIAAATADGGNGMININGVDYAATSAVVDKLRGDLEEQAATAWEASNASDVPLNNFNKVLADSLGVSDISATDYGDLRDATSLKKLQKKMDGDAFTLEHSAEFAQHKADAGAIDNK